MAAYQAPPSLGFSRQEHWSGLPFPSPMTEQKAFELTVHGVVLKHISQIIYWAEVVDTYDLDVIAFHSCTENDHQLDGHEFG